MKRSSIIFALAAMLVALGALAASLVFMPGSRMADVISSGEALVGGEFEATNQDGARVTDKDFLGKYTLYYFGYTYCPDVCPAELQVISAALAQVPDAEQKFQVVFTSIDPKRDTPQVMKDYVANFWPGTVGLTGSAEDIRNMAGKFRVYYSRAGGKEGEGKDDYLMDHSSIVYLMGPDGKFIRHFAFGTPADDMANELKKAVKG